MNTRVELEPEVKELGRRNLAKKGLLTLIFVSVLLTTLFLSSSCLRVQVYGSLAKTKPDSLAHWSFDQLCKEGDAALPVLLESISDKYSFDLDLKEPAETPSTAAIKYTYLNAWETLQSASQELQSKALKTIVLESRLVRPWRLVMLMSGPLPWDTLEQLSKNSDPHIRFRAKKITSQLIQTTEFEMQNPFAGPWPDEQLNVLQNTEKRILQNQDCPELLELPLLAIRLRQDQHQYPNVRFIDDAILFEAFEPSFLRKSSPTHHERTAELLHMIGSMNFSFEDTFVNCNRIIHPNQIDQLVTYASQVYPEKATPLLQRILRTVPVDQSYELQFKNLHGLTRPALLQLHSYLKEQSKTTKIANATAKKQAELQQILAVIEGVERDSPQAFVKKFLEVIQSNNKYVALSYSLDYPHRNADFILGVYRYIGQLSEDKSVKIESLVETAAFATHLSNRLYEPRDKVLKTLESRYLSFRPHLSDNTFEFPDLKLTPYQRQYLVNWIAHTPFIIQRHTLRRKLHLAYRINELQNAGVITRLPSSILTSEIKNGTNSIKACWNARIKLANTLYEQFKRRGLSHVDKFKTFRLFHSVPTWKIRNIAEDLNVSRDRDFLTAAYEEGVLVFKDLASINWTLAADLLVAKLANKKPNFVSFERTKVLASCTEKNAINTFAKYIEKQPVLALGIEWVKTSQNNKIKLFRALDVEKAPLVAKCLELALGLSDGKPLLQLLKAPQSSQPNLINSAFNYFRQANSISPDSRTHRVFFQQILPAVNNRQQLHSIPAHMLCGSTSLRAKIFSIARESPGTSNQLLSELCCLRPQTLDDLLNSNLSKEIANDFILHLANRPYAAPAAIQPIRHRVAQSIREQDLASYTVTISALARIDVAGKAAITTLLKLAKNNSLSYVYRAIAICGLRRYYYLNRTQTDLKQLIAMLNGDLKTLAERSLERVTELREEELEYARGIGDSQ